MRWRSIAYQWVTVVVLFSVLLAIQYYRPEWTGISMGQSGPGENVYRAIDGDSFKAGETEIRLHGIDAPEYRQMCTDASGKQHACGRMARDALSGLIAGKDVTCTIIERDRYRREVSVCREGAREINREMVRLGWALAYRHHALTYVAAEREAKQARRGIWAWRFDVPEDYRNRNRGVAGSLVGED